MSSTVSADIESFLAAPIPNVGPVFNEHGLQLELGIHLRCLGYEIQFERPFKLENRSDTTKKPKRELDMLVLRNGHRVAVELKTPLAGRVPETMYDFCADIQFVEQLIAMQFADAGLCLLVTTDRQFWHSDLRGDGIYGYFRNSAMLLNGAVGKPTGARDTIVVLAGSYNLAPAWKPLGNSNLLADARYLLVSVERKL